MLVKFLILYKLQTAESNDEVDIYTAEITNTKATVFQIVRCYVECSVTFCMTDNLIGESSDVLYNPYL